MLRCKRSEEGVVESREEIETEVWCNNFQEVMFNSGQERLLHPDPCSLHS